MVVIDANFVLPLFVSHPDADKFEAVIIQLRQADALISAPSLWTYEVTSAIQKLAHFQMLPPQRVDEALNSMMRFEINLVEPTPDLVREAVRWSRRLQRANAYDSFYLALAQAHQCELWTTDQKLVNAVNAPWVRSV